MKIKVFALLIIAAVVLSACGSSGNATSDIPLNQPPVPSGDGGEDAPVSFANDVFPILNSRCITCHGGDRIEGELVMLSYEELMSGGKDGAVIIPGDADGSLLYQLASTGEMPKRGANLNPAQLQIIMQWINEGAPNN